MVGFEVPLAAGRGVLSPGAAGGSAWPPLLGQDGQPPVLHVWVHTLPEASGVTVELPAPPCESRAAVGALEAGAATEEFPKQLLSGSFSSFSF